MMLSKLLSPTGVKMPPESVDVTIQLHGQLVSCANTTLVTQMHQDKVSPITRNRYELSAFKDLLNILSVKEESACKEYH